MGRYWITGADISRHVGAGLVGFTVEPKANDQIQRWGRLFNFCIDMQKCFSLRSRNFNSNLI